MASIKAAPKAVQQASDAAVQYVKQNFAYIALYRNWVQGKQAARLKLYCVMPHRTSQLTGLPAGKVLAALRALGFTVTIRHGRVSATLYHTAHGLLPALPTKVNTRIPRAPRRHCAHCGHAL